MANINVTVSGGAAISAQVGENTLAAANSATAAEGFRDEAEGFAADAAQSAAYAGGFETPEYSSQSAGNAATTAGQIFRVPIGTTPQTFNWYRRLSSGSEMVDPLATSGALAASGGAALVGSQGGGTVQDSLTGVFANLIAGVDQSSALSAVFSLGNFDRHRVANLPAGTFDIKDVQVPSNMHLRGKGMDFTVLRRSGELTTAILTFALGGNNITISDMTIDGASAADLKSLVSMGAHGGNIRFERVRFRNGCQRWALRGNPIAQFQNFNVLDCEFVDCPMGGPIIIAGNAAVAGSRNINFIRNTFLRCGGNICGIRPHGVQFQFDFYFDVKFNYNTILDCTNTGTFGPIPVEIWGATRFQQIGNYLNSGTRGLSAGEGQRNGVIAHNIIMNQTAYAMEGGNNADTVHIHSNVAINCASFHKDTGAVATGGNITRGVVIENNLIVGTGLSAHNATTPDDAISLGNDNATIVTDCIIRNNVFRDLRFQRSVIRVRPIAASSNQVVVEDNRYTSSNYEDAIEFVNCQDVNFVSRNNFVRRTANFDSSHPRGASQSFYLHAGRLAEAGASCVSENDAVEMTGTVSSGTLYAIGRIESATARYGCRVSGFRAAGNFSSGPFRFADSTGTTILEGFDLRGLADTTPMAGLNAALPLGLRDGVFLLPVGGYVKAGQVRERRKVFRFEGTAATREIKIRCDLTTGGQPPAHFDVDFTSVNNNGTPQSNRVRVAFGSVTAPASAPLMWQDASGTAATLASGVDSSLMVATITLPASNNSWVATISADAAGNGTNGALASYSVRVG